MSKILDNCRLTNNIVFDVNYLTGSISDKSPYKAAATVTGQVSWTRTRLGNAVMFGTGGYISYADNSANRLTGIDYTIIALGKFRTGSYYGRPICKCNVAGTGYQLYFHGTVDNRVSIFDLSSTRYAQTTGLTGRSLLIFTSTSGGVPICYLDGVKNVVADGAFTINSSTTPILVGNYTTGNFPLRLPLNRITLLNRVLSPAEISQLYTELMSEQYPIRAYSFGSRISAPIDPPGVPALLKTDFTTKLPDGRLADLSGNGWYGTIQPGFVAGPGMCGNALVANSATRSYVDFGDILTINGATKLTTIWYGKRGSSNAIEAIYSKSATVNTKLSSYFTTTTFQNDAYFSASDSNVNVPLFRADVYDGTQVLASRGQIYSDNNKLTTTVTASCPTSLPNNTGVNLKVGSLGYATANQPSDKYEFFAIYNYALTDSQVGFIYKQIARRKTFTLDMQRVPITLANITGPSEVPNTPFMLKSGATMRISEDTAGKRWFESVSSTYDFLYTQQKQTSGTFVFDVYHTASEWISPISNTTLFSDTNRNIYTVLLIDNRVILYRLNPANGNTELFTATNAVVYSTAYSIAISRNSSCSFSFYIKGGIYKIWTLLTPTTGTNPVVDTTYTSSAYCLLSVTNGGSFSKFSRLNFFQGVLTIADLIELGL